MKNDRFKDFVNGTAKQIKNAYKRNELKVRANGELRYNPDAAKLANCLEHAVFNFSDETLKGFIQNYGKDICLFWFNFDALGSMFDEKLEKQYKKVTAYIIDRIRLTGLKVKKCDIDAKPKGGQWKVAYYFSYGGLYTDFHFFRQEKDGRWSSKHGTEKEVHFFDELPKSYRDSYTLQSVYMITNPYHEKIKDDENE